MDKKDIFGKALYSYWKGDHKTPHIIRRDDHKHAHSINSSTYFSQKLHPKEKEIVKYAKWKILDIGCGAGRHVLFFQKKNFDITGIDPSPLKVKVCKEHGCKKVI